MGKLVALVVFVLVTLLAPRPARADGGMARVKSTGVLKWGGDIQGGEPYAYSDPKDPTHIIGFEVDIADAIARELGVRAEFVQNDWSNLVPSLERGSFDVVLNGLEVVESRVGRILFSRPYFVFAERLMARKKDPSIVPDLAKLKGKRVGTLSNSLAHEMLRATEATAVLYEGSEEPYIDLQRGRTDAVLLDDILASRYGEPKTDLRTVGDLRDGYYAMAIRLDEPDLRDALDAALERITKSGELRRILERRGLWGSREERLSTWSAADQAKLLGLPAPAPSAVPATNGSGASAAEARAPIAPAPTPPAPPGLSSAHVVLFLQGALVTLFVSTLAMAIAVPLGLVLSIARMFGGPFARGLAGAYVELYRGTPVLLQLYLLYYGLSPVLKLGAIPAAVIGLGMNYAAYESEVYRAGLQAVPKAQMDAALALGMSTRLALRRIVLPQAIRHAIPNVTNDFIALLKDSSLVSVITVVELTKQMTITAVDVRSWLGPGLLCAGLYFAMSFPLGVLARRLEKKLEGERNERDSEGHADDEPKTSTPRAAA